MKIFFTIQENPNKWKEKELDKFFDYCTKNRDQLVKNLFQNIQSRKKTIKKPQNFFLNLSKAVKTKNKSQCKSKYQKLEQLIIQDILNIQPKHYQQLQELRKTKPISNAKLKTKKKRE